MNNVIYKIFEEKNIKIHNKIIIIMKMNSIFFFTSVAGKKKYNLIEQLKNLEI